MLPCNICIYCRTAVGAATCVYLHEFAANTLGCCMVVGFMYTLGYHEESVCMICIHGVLHTCATVEFLFGIMLSMRL